MQLGMPSTTAAADAIDYLCQPSGLDHGKSSPSGKHLMRLDCQLCQSLHVLAQGLTPEIGVLVLLHQPSARRLPLTAEATLTIIAARGFSSRAPPNL
jgi:hypothetical protein